MIVDTSSIVSHLRSRVQVHCLHALSWSKFEGAGHENPRCTPNDPPDRPRDQSELPAYRKCMPCCILDVRVVRCELLAFRGSTRWLGSVVLDACRWCLRAMSELHDHLGHIHRARLETRHMAHRGCNTLHRPTPLGVESQWLARSSVRSIRVGMRTSVVRRLMVEGIGVDCVTSSTSHSMVCTPRDCRSCNCANSSATSNYMGHTSPGNRTLQRMLGTWGIGIDPSPWPRPTIEHDISKLWCKAWSTCTNEPKCTHMGGTFYLSHQSNQQCITYLYIFWVHVCVLSLSLSLSLSLYISLSLSLSRRWHNIYAI